MTLLLVDAGNTRVKWGFHREGEWLSVGALPRTEAAKLSSVWAESPSPERALGCMVADSDTQARIEQAVADRGLAMQWAGSQPTQGGLLNGYDEPMQLGADRWLGMLAARQRTASVARPCIVLSAGTAVTIDAVTSRGEFIGGVILPGATLMAEALERGTAGLKRQPGRFKLPPTNTADAIATGAFIAIGGALRRMESALAARGERDCEVYITGGGAPDLQPTLDRPVTLIPNLVLEGLLVVAAMTGAA